MNKKAVAGIAFIAVTMGSSASWANRVEVSTPCSAPESTVGSKTTKAAAVMSGLISDHVSGQVSSGSAGSASSDTTTPNFGVAAQANSCGETPAPAPVPTLTDTDQAASSKKSNNENGVWVADSYSWMFKDDPNAKFHGQVANSIVGFDHKLNNATVAGVALGYEHYNFKTDYNGGTVLGHNWTVAPYVGYAVNEWLSLDATAGHGWVSYDYTRTNDSISGSTTASRWFGSADINAKERFDDFVLRGSVGYLKIFEDQKGYTETDGTNNDKSQVNLGQGRVTVAGSYELKESWGTYSPNGFIRYEYDFNAPPSSTVSTTGVVSSNRMGATFGLGSDFILNDGWKLGFSGSAEEFRRNSSLYTLMGTARYSF